MSEQSKQTEHKIYPAHVRRAVVDLANMIDSLRGPLFFGQMADRLMDLLLENETIAADVKAKWNELHREK